jgi:CspA family cold shock protein
MEGTIVRLVKDKGYGFIRAKNEDGGKDHFFHKSALKNSIFDSLQLGQEVTFEDAETQQGLRAEDVYI